MGRKRSCSEVGQAMPEQVLSLEELYEAWPALSSEERLDGFTLLSRGDSEELFSELEARDQAELLLSLPEPRRRVWMRFLAPDDAADVIQEAPEEQRESLLDLLDGPTRKEVIALLAYNEDDAGGLMNPRYARLRPDITTDEALSYLRRQTEERAEIINYGYVLDAQQNLLGVVSLRELFAASRDKKVREIMRSELITVPEEMDQEEVSRLVAQHDLVALPVVDGQGRMKGIVTVDDIVDVVQEEATEDMHKLGGTEALEAPYLQVALLEMLRKRLGWLALLLLLGFFAVEVIRRFRDQVESAIVLAMFLPLIIASGGNSGSQAATLVVRAMALDEVRLRDWWRVIIRELSMGLTLGAALGVLGLLMVLLWHSVSETGLGEHYWLVAVTVACSILSVALWGTFAGSMLPFVLRRFGFDPASASAPLVATVVDASGLVIYFVIASSILRGTIL
jgi:magnesium transporter